jgi:glycosyltransferase
VPLNKGIKISSGEYYVVAGADDVFYPNAIEDYKKYIDNNVDMITANIKINQKTSFLDGRPSWLVGQYHWLLLML